MYFGGLVLYTYFNASYKVKMQKACKRNHNMLNRKAQKYRQVPFILNDHQKIITSANI